MKEITYIQFMSNTLLILNQVANDYSPILITRKKGNSVVLLSLKSYEAIEQLVGEMEAYLPNDLNNHGQ